MAELTPLLQDFTVRIVRDQSEFIEAALVAIQEHLLLGGLFAGLVVFIFLWNLRTTIIAAVAIPTSIIGAFSVMAALGFSTGTNLPAGFSGTCASFDKSRHPAQ